MRIIPPAVLPAWAALALLLGLLPASAAGDGRYSFDRSGDAIVRLDSETGEVVTCRAEGGQVVCPPGAAGDPALGAEVERLRRQVEALEKRLAAVEAARPGAPQNALPSDEELDRTLGFMERFFRRFVDIVKDLDKNLGKEEAPPAPQKT